MYSSFLDWPFSLSRGFSQLSTWHLLHFSSRAHSLFDSASSSFFALLRPFSCSNSNPDLSWGRSHIVYRWSGSKGRKERDQNKRYDYRGRLGRVRTVCVSKAAEGRGYLAWSVHTVMKCRNWSRMCKIINLIAANPWLCDSGLEWFRRLLRDNLDIDIDKPGCVSACAAGVNGCPIPGTPLR